AGLEPVMITMSPTANPDSASRLSIPPPPLVFISNSVIAPSPPPPPPPSSTPNLKLSFLMPASPSGADAPPLHLRYSRGEGAQGRRDGGRRALAPIRENPS